MATSGSGPSDDRRQPPVALASKEGMVLASMALYGIFYFMLYSTVFAGTLEDPELFKYYTAFFMASFFILTITGVIMIAQRPGIIRNELLGMAFFLTGGIILFIVPYSRAVGTALPLPDSTLLIFGSIFYMIGVVLYARDGGYFTAWLVGSGLTIALAGHEAMGIVQRNGIFGPYDTQLWTIGFFTLLISIILFAIHQVKLRFILIPLIEKGSRARQAKRYNEALEQFNRALRLYPSFTTALNNKGNVLFNLGRFSESRECYEAALRIDPYYANARRNLSVLRRKAA